jgi:methylated-DNA-protein-cysteine methyltransferase related protein
MKSDDSFFIRVYEVVRLIPSGRVTSYGAIAKAIGSPGASRMVGWAMNKSHTYPEHVPAQRVVDRNGMLTGKHHFRHPKLMQELLESEGVKVENDKVKGFKDLFWDPSSELV